MPSKSKSKGSRFEYKVRDLLNALYQSNEFARTPGSGAIMGRSNFAKRSGLSEAAQDTLGADMICPAWFPYSIEAKSYADKPSFHAIIHTYDQTLDWWLGETIFDAKNFKKIPLLFFNTTRKGSYVALPEILAKELVLGNYLVYRDFRIISMAQFAENALVIKSKAFQLLVPILEWMESSSHCQALNTMQDVKADKKKVAKKTTKKVKIIEGSE